MIVEPTLCGECYWEINDDGVFAVYGAEEGADSYQLDYWSSKPPWYEYRGQIKSAAITSDTIVTQTMQSFFYGCTNLISAYLGALDTSAVTTMANAFCGCANLSTLEFGGFDTSAVTSMGKMFYNCQMLAALDLSDWDVSSVRSFDSMFYGCSNLQTVDTTGWDTASLTSIDSMFYSCASLTTITGVAKWDTSRVTSMQYAFRYCASLVTLDLSGWDVSSVDTFHRMFQGCTALTTIYATEWTDEAVAVEVSSGMFLECASLVGAVAYADVNGTNIAYANTTTGYFTSNSTTYSGSISGGTVYGLSGSVIYPTVTATKITSETELSIYYESASGGTVDFNGDTLWIQEPETLFKGLWEYDSYDSAYGGGKVTRFYRPVEESDEVSLEVVADSYDDYVSIVEEAHDIFESDIRNLTAGKLYINGTYRECYIHSRSYEDFDRVLASATMEVSALYTGESWIEELVLEAADIAEAAETLSDGTGIMRPADVDVSSPAGITLAVELDYPVYPVITFYGPAESPWVTIGSEFYQCRQTIYEDEYIVYDAKNRTVTGYIESAREPDENSYSVGIPDDWEAGDTLYRAALFTTSDGGSLFIGPQTSYTAGEGDVTNNVTTISDVLLSAESGVAWGDVYITVSDVVTLGSGNENTGSYAISYAKVFDGYTSVFEGNIERAEETYYAEMTEGDSFADFTAEASRSSPLLAIFYVDLDQLGIDSDIIAEIGFALISSSYDSVTVTVVPYAYEDSGAFGGTSAAFAEITTTVGSGLTTARIDLTGADGISVSFTASENITAGDSITIAGGYLTPEGKHPVSGQMVYANSAIGEKNWFEYRNLDLDPFEPIQPGESTVYFESDTTFDLTVLQERSEPPWM